MSSSIVIKVKFGETLRRFSASINDKKLALDTAMLREKIRGLFSFDSGVEFTLTYVDEDGDVVTLADDNDLHDVVRQSLNPLRITVSLNKTNPAGLNGNFTPLRSPQSQFPFPTLNSGVSEIMKSVHEPIRQVLANLPLNLVSKASSSSPAVADLVEKMTAVYMDQIFASPKVNPPTGGPSNVNSESSTVKDGKVPVNSEAGSSNSKKKDKQVENASEGFKFKDVQQPLKGVDLNVPFFQYEPLQKDENSGPRPACFTTPGIESESPGHHHRHSRSPHWKRYSLDNNGLGNVIHMGVGCDGCGVHPLTGPRYKSKVKVNYDLCSVCFAGTGDAADYMRIDRPTNAFRHHTTFKGFHDPSHRMPFPTLPHALRAPGSKLPRSKLDSRFILDVNVLDGTIIAPFTSFTKIWRMRNNGSVIWPHGSQLQWIGGDRLSNSHSVDVEIPVDGLPVDQELDIAVDFIAPELPGRYVSYWRMSSPSGQKYGQRVWVLIQVDASMKDLGETSINLNLPPVVNYPEVANEYHPLVDRNLSGNNIIKVTDSGNTSVVDSQFKNQEMNFPINDSLIIDSPAISSVFNPTEVETALASLPSGPVNSATQEVSVDQEQALVNDLEDMGFKQLDLNKEVLRMNNYDLQKSIDDLCGVSDWDPMLDELQEMGFEDNEANRRLLKKNNGSIKRVVMDLINGEKA